MLKVVKSCSFALLCSDTFAVGCIVYPQCAASQTDRQTDDSIMPTTDHTVCSKIGFKKHVDITVTETLTLALHRLGCRVVRRNITVAVASRGHSQKQRW